MFKAVFVGRFARIGSAGREVGERFTIGELGKRETVSVVSCLLLVLGLTKESVSFYYASFYAFLLVFCKSCLSRICT